ncbi:hypothetical protein LCGC14_2296930 [marine sediment metagenome]|uniref:Uncharacterized protein n=1 Tax=marine sediment metagenome TaxID=412755 RepID=A0A0F9CQ59_9ZZZZ
MKIIKLIANDLKKDKLFRNLYESDKRTFTRVNIATTCFKIAAFCMLAFIFLIVIMVVF